MRPGFSVPHHWRVKHWIASVSYGGLPTWLAAIGTVGVSMWLLVLQLRDRRMGRMERREEQARHISAWLVDWMPTVDPPTLTVRVLNGSLLAIYQVTVRIPVGVRGTFIRQVPAMGPGETREWRVTLPGQQRGDIYAPDVMFVDAASVTWIRQAAGALIAPQDSEERTDWRPDPGAYGSDEAHPTLAPTGEGLDGWSGRKVD